MHDERFVLGKYNLRMIFQWCFNLVSTADTMVDKQKKKKRSAYYSYEMSPLSHSVNYS